jgi:holo-[acyl-carrier protein] synthase
VILGLGVDVCSIGRWAAMAARRPGLVKKLLTPAEAGLAAESQAARFAAKEALVKALGGVAFPWHDAEVVADAAGRPAWQLGGAAAEAARRLGVARTHLSLSHDGGVAVAVTVLEGDA